MARVVSRTVNSTLSLHIDKIKYNGDVVSAETYSAGDVVTDLRYVKNDEVQTVSGRIVRFNVQAVSTKTNYLHNTDDFSKRHVITDIIIDASEQYSSNIVTVPCHEIVESAGEEGIAKIKTYSSIEGEYILGMSDGDDVVIPLKAGTFIDELRILNGPGKEDIVDTFYVVTLLAKTIKVEGGTGLSISGMILVKDHQEYPCMLSSIIGAEGVYAPETDEAAIDEAISSKGAVAIGAVEYSKPITINKEFTICGANFGVIANGGPRSIDAEISGETILSGAITIGDDADVLIDGVTITKDALINVSANAKSLTIKNTRFIQASPSKAKTMLINTVEGAGTSCVVKIENCLFGSNPVVGDNKIYHTFEFTGFLGNGSSIKNNTFKDGSVTHNNINIYNIEDGAEINISGNVFDYSGNAICIGTKGDETGTINIAGNTYYATDERGDGIYAGLLIIQPYGTATTNMSNIAINITKTIHNDKYPIGYRYYGEGVDTELTDENSPVVKVNGIITKFPLVVG